MLQIPHSCATQLCTRSTFGQCVAENRKKLKAEPTVFFPELWATEISRYKIGGDLARPLQLFIFTPLDDLETQVISETILWPAIILQREITVLNWLATQCRPQSKGCVGVVDGSHAPLKKVAPDKSQHGSGSAGNPQGLQPPP